MSAQVFTGRYQIVRKIARGGMAEVYLAQDLLLERPVALKVLFPEFSSDKSFVERFRREARAAANLNHPSIVAIYDWGEDDGTYFIVMEYVDGVTLRELITTDGPVSVSKAARIGSEIAGALHFAHLNGVIHRDVKPGNVIFTRGHVKVTDFGIARGGDPGESLTQTGAVMGTATYFSPEQAQGHTVDPRSDVYSLGVVLYEMVTQRPPFTGDSPLSIAYQHVRETPVPPSKHNPEIPPAFDLLVLKAMAKDRSERHADADELREDLLAFYEGRLSNSRPQPIAVIAPPPAAEPTVVAPVAHLDDRTLVAPGPRTPVGSREPPRNRTGTYIVVLALLLALLAGLLFLLSRELGGRDTAGAEIAVPGVIGKDVGEARRELEDAGLKVDTVDQENDGQIGRVIEQDPAAGAMVERDSTVRLTVGVGAARVSVPSVVNLTLDAATATLEGAGFEVVVNTEPSNRAAANTVIRQDPAAGAQAPKGSGVTLTVSSGPDQVPVPDVRNRSSVDAANLLGEAGFRTSQRPAPSTDTPDGTVIRTEPAAGTRLPRGSTVVLVVSSGPPEPTTVAPTTEPSTTTTEPTTTTADVTPTTKKKD